MVCIASLELREEPHNAEVEQQILGSIFLDEKKMNELSETVKTDMFYHQQHKDIYNAMLYLFFNNSVIDYKTVINRLTFKKVEHDIDYILNISNNVLNMKNFDNQVKILVELYEKRVLFNYGKSIVSKDISGIASSVMVKEIEGLMEKMGTTSNIETASFNEYIDDWVEWLESDEKPQKYKFGLRELDDTVLLENSNLVILAARPSVGKSALALTFVKNFLKQGYKTLFVSLEMSRKEIMNRLVSNVAHVPSRKLKRKEPLTKEERDSIMRAKEDIRKYNMNVYDKSGMKIEQLFGLAKKLKKDGKLDILVVDYLQLLETYKKTAGRTQEVEYISRKLKQIASELNIPVIALSQLSRASIENGKAREPQLTDLRQSGSIEQDANSVLMLHSDDVDNKHPDRKYLDLFVRKNRDGRLGHIKYTYYGDYLQFIEKKDYDTRKKKYIPVEQEPLFFEENEQEGLIKPKIKETQQIEDLPF